MASTTTPNPVVSHHASTKQNVTASAKPAMARSENKDVDIRFLHPIDNFRPMKFARIRNFFIVKTVLDDVILREALDSLIRHHLPILGSTIRETGKDKAWAYHQPKSFSKDAVLFRWSSSNIESRLEDANILPQKPAEDAVFFGPENTASLEAKWAPAHWNHDFKPHKPRSPATPLLFVHITHYTDATVVGLSLPHSVCDQMGFGLFVKSWMEVVRGDEPAPFIEFEPGAFDGPNFTRKELEAKGKGCRALSKLDRKKIYLSIIPELIRRPKEITRQLMIPESVVKRLQGEAAQTLKSTYGDDAIIPTNSDILYGILLKLNYYGGKGPRFANLTTTVNARGRLSILPASKPYLHNAVCFTSIPLKITNDTPVAEIAYKHRLAFIELCKEENLQRSYAIQKELVRKDEIMMGLEPKHQVGSMIIWYSAWHGLSFSAAAKANETKETAQDSIFEAPLMVGSGMDGALPRRGVGVVMCKSDGYYWCDFTVHSERMVWVEELLKSNPGLENF